jgi:hypothetical protein
MNDHTFIAELLRRLSANCASGIDQGDDLGRHSHDNFGKNSICAGLQDIYGTLSGLDDWEAARAASQLWTENQEDGSMKGERIAMRDAILSSITGQDRAEVFTSRQSAAVFKEATESWLCVQLNYGRPADSPHPDNPDKQILT